MEGAEHVARGVKAKGLLPKGLPGLKSFSNHCAALHIHWGLIPGKGLGYSMTELS